MVTFGIAKPRLSVSTSPGIRDRSMKTEQCDSQRFLTFFVSLLPDFQENVISFLLAEQYTGCCIVNERSERISEIIYFGWWTNDLMNKRRLLISSYYDSVCFFCSSFFFLLLRFIVSLCRLTLFSLLVLQFLSNVYDCNFTFTFTDHEIIFISKTSIIPNVSFITNGESYVETLWNIFFKYWKHVINIVEGNRK